MIAEDMAIQALRTEVSELNLRLKELGQENRDLREICNEFGIRYEELLAARRHKRHFADLCDKHPIASTATASDLLGADPIVRGIAACAGLSSPALPLRTGLIARCFFAAIKQLTAQFPWRFGSYLSATFEGHRNSVLSVAMLEGGRLASGADDYTIRVWDLATRTCVAAFLAHDDTVRSVAVLEGGRLASGASGMPHSILKIWDLATGACVATLEGHKDAVIFSSGAGGPLAGERIF